MRIELYVCNPSTGRVFFCCTSAPRHSSNALSGADLMTCKKPAADQILELQDTLHRLAPVLCPFPSLGTLLFREQATTDVDACAKALGQDAGTLFQESKKKDARQKKRVVCAYCGAAVETLTPGALTAAFRFDPVHSELALEALNVTCTECRKLRCLDEVLCLSGKAIAAETLSSAQPVPPASAAPLLAQEAELTSKMDQLYRHFLQVNRLDAHADATAFQNTLSVAFALHICAKTLTWTLKDGRQRC